MNEVMLIELKIVVERAVRPVRATMARKRRMREELLAHLVAIFDEEAQRLGDEQAALEQAKRRFGDPRELTPQFQQAVPWWDRCRAVLENLGYRSDEAAWHLAAKHFLAMLPIHFVLLLLLMWKFEGQSDLGPIEAHRIMSMAFLGVGAVVVISLFNVILSVVLAPLLHKIGPVLASKHRGRIVLGVLCVFVLLCGFAVPGIAGAAILSLLMARQAVKQWRYQADWA
jgi:hypothetical protein